ncbi:MAG: sterol desaturase family protein, partial [Flavobacteriales bacterium]|nr:sterol desaturase family protein [Flavobacteriales bacterium]
MPNIIILSIPIFFLLIGLELIWDLVQRKRGKPGVYRLNDALTNISCGIIDQVTGIFAKLFTIGTYVIAFNLAREVFPWQMPENWMWFVVAFVAIDFAYYWSHRLSHQVNLFWTGHVVHHQSEDYNLSVALRQGAFQKILMFWVYLPLAAIGLPPAWFVISLAINLLYQFWIHTEAVGKMGPLEFILNTPSHHRVHHGRNPKYIDRNHGGIFIVWD